VKLDAEEKSFSLEWDLGAGETLKPQAGQLKSYSADGAFTP